MGEGRKRTTRSYRSQEIRGERRAWPLQNGQFPYCSWGSRKLESPSSAPNPTTPINRLNVHSGDDAIALEKAFDGTGVLLPSIANAVGVEQRSWENLPGRSISHLQLKRIFVPAPPTRPNSRISALAQACRAGPTTGPKGEPNRRFSSFVHLRAYSFAR